MTNSWIHGSSGYISQPSQLAACQVPADEAHSLPPEFYVSPAVSDLESEKIFRASWLGIGRADRIAAPGDYATLDIAGQAIIVLRDKNKRPRAFANTCRHRGARLLDGDGNCQGIRCPFHSWAYKLDGALAAAPHMDTVSGFDKSDFGLTEYRIAERLGFLFVCLSPDAPSLDEYLGDFEKIHAEWPLERLISTCRRELTIDCNWKGFLEVFNEYYHLPFVHPDSISNVYNPPDSADQVNGSFATQYGATSGTGGLLEKSQSKALPMIPGLQGRAAKGVRYSWVFPNMTFAAGTDALWIYEAYPDGADRCHVVQTICFPPETMAHAEFEDRATAYYGRLDAALAEDVPALVNQQRGLACPDARPGRFQPDLEPNVAAFARWYAAHWQF